MKKKTTILTILIVLISTVLNAAVWRVNNRPNVDADFTTLQDAINGASDGDTLYIGASETSYGNGIFAKKLIVIGVGYWHSENDTTQSYQEESQTGKLTFNNGSQGSIIQGLYIYYTLSSAFNVIEINTDSITVARNYIYAYNTSSSPSSVYGNAIFLSANTANIDIRHNWIDADVHHSNYSYSGVTAVGIYAAGVLENAVVKSNFIRSHRSSSYGGYYAVYVATNNPFNEFMLSTNVMWGNLRTFYTNHYDNILVSGTYYIGAGDEFYNNLCDGTQYPNSNNNQQNVDMSTVFIDYIGYIDNDYILADGSPAIGAATTGGDCGAFGDDPYILSGMPPIPAVFATTVVPYGTSSLPVNIKAISHN